MIINVVAVIVALAALGVSGFFAYRQLNSARANNAAQVAMEMLTRTTRSDEFIEGEDFVINKLTEAYSADGGVAALPISARKHVDRIAFFYADLGVLSLFAGVDSDLIVATMHGRILRTWYVLEPYIRAERRIRNGDRYLNFFEHIACLCSSADIKALHSRLGLQEFKQSAVTNTDNKSIE
jgi:hypothetical protein